MHENTLMNQALELRALTGLHRDERCAISDGALLGADSNCDIVLADTGLSGQAGRTYWRNRLGA
jgi:type III secretion protein D